MKREKKKLPKKREKKKKMLKVKIIASHKMVGEAYSNNSLGETVYIRKYFVHIFQQ